MSKFKNLLVFSLFFIFNTPLMALDKIIKIDTQGGTVATKEELAKIPNLSGIFIQNNKILDGCDNPLKVKIHTVNLGKELENARVLTAGSSCYGMVGGYYVIIDKNNKILMQQEAAGLSILETKHDGVHDILIGMQGTKQPIWAWNSKLNEYDFLESVHIDFVN